MSIITLYNMILDSNVPSTIYHTRTLNTIQSMIYVNITQREPNLLPLLSIIIDVK